MKQSIKYCKDLVRHNKIKQVSENIFEVENHTVTIQKKMGAKLITCDCLNHSRNCNSPAFCVHKMAVIIYLSNRDFIERINKLILEYNSFKDNKLTPSVDCIIDDLNNIKYKW